MLVTIEKLDTMRKKNGGEKEKERKARLGRKHLRKRNMSPHV